MGSIPINIYTFNQRTLRNALLNTKLIYTSLYIFIPFYCGLSVEIRVVSLSVVCKITVQKQRGSWTSGALPQQPIFPTTRGIKIKCAVCKTTTIIRCGLGMLVMLPRACKRKELSGRQRFCY